MEKIIKQGNFIIVFNSSVKIKNEMDRTSSTHGEMRNAHIILVGKPERSLRYRWEDNVKMDDDRKWMWWHGINLTGS
jgi:hypothetical protein